MTAILGYLDLIMEGCPRRCEFGREEIGSYVDTALKNAKLLLQIINDILDLSKIEAGKLQVDRIRCSPRQILSEVAELLKVRAEAKGLAISLDFDRALPEAIDSDPVRLRQILINLVGNAIKFTEIGEVRLTAGPVFAADGPQLEIRVIDSGIGMTRRQVAEIFRPFSQVDASASRRFGGTGLGLMLSKRLAELLGGDVRVETEPGKGSTFSLVIPAGPLEKQTEMPGQVTPQTAIHETSRPPSSSGPWLACRVLLVEDGPDNQRLISILLRKAGAEVVIAENGQAALDRVQAAEQQGCRFDVILMDMQMPVLDGYQATRRLRAAGWDGPILALTAHAMSGARQECLEAGCNDFLSKPIDRSLLLDAVARYSAGSLHPSNRENSLVPLQAQPSS
jgi:CheY-like chemotaxis protein/anti-sigma regulatory factor (Ser/Thr protein kinase)